MEQITVEYGIKAIWHADNGVYKRIYCKFSLYISILVVTILFFGPGHICILFFKLFSLMD